MIKSKFKKLEPETKGMLIGFIGIAIFSLTLPFTRIAVLELSPLFVAFGRASVAGLCAFILLLLTKPARPTWSQFKRLMLVAVGVVYGFSICTAMAMRSLPSAHSGIVLGILPLMTSIFGVLRFKERPSFLFWVTACIGAGLVLLYAFLDGAGTLNIHDMWLVLAIIFAAMGYSEGGKLAGEIGAVNAISWALVMTLPINLVLVYLSANASLLHASLGAWLAFLYVGLFSMFIGFFFWYRGIALGGIARVGQVQLLQPFMTLIGAYFLLGEPLSVTNICFAIAVLVVVFIGRKTKVDTPIVLID